MSDYYDDDGHLLGQWEPCDTDTYENALISLGSEGTVFAGRTEVGERTSGYDEEASYVGRHIYTEWGRRGDDLPTCRCEDIWDNFGVHAHVDALFVRFTVTEDEVA